MRLPRLSEWHVVGSVRGKRGRRVVVMEIGGLSAQAVGSMRGRGVVQWNARVVEESGRFSCSRGPEDG